MRIFFVLLKRSFPSSSCSFFFEIFLPQPPVVFSTDFNQSVICSFTKSLENCYKKRLQPKTCSGSYQRNRTPSAKRLRQTLFFRSRASLVIESSLLKLKIITTCFEQYIFHNNLKNNVYGQICSQKYCLLLPKQENSSQTFL